MPVLFLVFIMLRFELRDGVCVNEGFIEQNKNKYIYITGGYLWVSMYYFVPMIIVIFCYIQVIYTMIKRQQNSNLPASPVLASASTNLTYTAILVTLCFILLYGYDSFYTLLDIIKVFDYPDRGTFLQKMAMFLAALNSGCNPFIYLCTLPVFRRCVVNTFVTCRHG